MRDARLHFMSAQLEPITLYDAIGSMMLYVFSRLRF